MRWWRKKRMGVARLGLFALLLQLTLSFGHVHVFEVIAPRTATDASVAAHAVSKSTAPTREQTSGRVPNDDCPICATMHLTATGLLPSPPSVAASLSFSHVSPQALIEAFDFLVSRHILFQTRAPPIA